MQTVRPVIAGRRAVAALRAVVVIGAALFVSGCNTDQQVAGVPAVPADYRMRHPITIKEADHTLQLFIGSNRGTLTASQRAQVLAFAQTWRSEATGGVFVDLPVGTSNERAAADSLREINSILAASGVPPTAIVVRSYRAEARNFATVRITYPKVTAQAGPCGLWPQDLGPSLNRDYVENQPYYNLGCSNQRNLAAMVENPSDLVQPRGETPAYTMRRTTVLEKYRLALPTATPSNNESSKISDVGK